MQAAAMILVYISCTQCQFQALCLDELGVPFQIQISDTVLAR
jgi:hypothetical protein